VSRTIVIAHRTCPVEAPENSLEGVRAAHEQGADGVEVDLRMSLDQQPFLMHDWTLRRTTGFPLPIELTPSFIVRRLRLQRTSARVPSLDELLDALPEGMLLAVDVKTPWAILPLLQRIRRRGITRQVLIWCTSAIAARYAAQRLPEAEVAYLNDVLEAEGKRRFLARAKAMGAKAISAHWRAIDAEFVGAAHAQGLKVYSWHGGSELTREKIEAGLDGLITDFVGLARRALHAVQGG
jgi:glycerophosphoryl diester phosphodiesterase